MLSRLWRPLSQSCDVLPKILNNIAPATFTTLHSTGSRKPSEKQRCNFTPLSGIKQNESHHLSSQRLFHISGQNYKNKIDWNDEIPDLLKYLYRKIRLSEYQLRKYSPQAITESASDDVKPYLRLMRFDRPIGTWLLFLPCAWSISLAAVPGHLPSISMLALFGAGSLLMRGAGCTINDMWDVDFDKRVARTRDRPLASGQVSRQSAFMFLGMQLTASLCILLSLNMYSVVLGMCSVGFVAAYPLMKRFTYWPQAFLGVTLNWGAMLGYSAIAGSCAWSVVLPLYASCCAWTLFYDTIYAHQDKQDDLMIGVKSTALLFGDETKDWLLKFGGAMIGGLVLTGLTSGQTFPYYLGVAYTAYHLHWQRSTVNLNNPDDCGNKFRSNRNLGLVLLAAIIASTLLKSDKRKAIQPQQVVPV